MTASLPARPASRDYNAATRVLSLPFQTVPIMKRMLPLIALLAAGTAAAEDAGLAVVEKLGKLNGQALACRQMEISMKAKNAVMANAPKTREVGERFEQTTNKIFLSPAPCGDRKRLATEVEAASVELRLAYPSVQHQTAADAEQPVEIVTRYLLVDHNGRTVTDQDFRGRFQLLTFGYTSCPDVCPTTLAEMAAVMRDLGEGAAKLQPIFVTVDPERDTAALLKNYTAAFDGRILGLTGSAEFIRRVADNYKVRFEKVQQPGAAAGNYAVDHTAGMYLLGPDGRFLAKYPYATPVKELTAKIRTYLTQ